MQPVLGNSVETCAIPGLQDILPFLCGAGVGGRELKPIESLGDPRDPPTVLRVRL